ncbi:hypothetical protein V1514DRAFT_328986 [Lipomyces japonicus]|uniref:uncharacterized protein n=1 Tax=Lipomyces japonicus TaxID=56871 RepID=UPI0034CD1F29
MVKLKEIPRTATFAWSPGSQPSLLATGTVAGAVDADFSSSSTLELWDPNFIDKSSDGFQLTSSKVSISTDARFHCLTWGAVTPQRPKGVIAGAQENGALTLWDPEALLQNSTTDSFFKDVTHTGAIKSLDFNPIQWNLLASAGSKGEIYVWDLDKLSTPLKPGTASSRLDEIESISWNNSVSHILATAGNTGFTSVWDLKHKREVLHLYYPGSSGNGRRGVSSVVWHPDNSTKLITASEDDSSPVILLWDLRNANAPEKILTGHEKGILSLSWCKKDSNLLLSSGKDNKTFLWNPESGEKLGEFPIATNWAFKTQWNPKNPDFFATASFDGKISVQSIQSTRNQHETAAAPKEESADFWSNTSYVDTQQPTFSLKQPPKWLRRPVSVSFGFGGKLVTVQKDKDGKKSDVKINKFIIEPGAASGTENFEEALNGQNLQSVAEARESSATSAQDKNDWNILLALYSDNPKQKLLEHLGYSEADVESLISKYKALSTEDTTALNGVTEQALTTEKVEDGSDVNFFDKAADTNGDSFLKSISSSQVTGAGSFTSSGPFTIFTEDTLEPDRLITQAIILGKFADAVDIALSHDRLSDAFILALSGGDDACRKKVQDAYFKKNADGPSYIRVLSSVTTKNLTDLVENADISNWKQVFVALDTFASPEELNKLFAKLGDRLAAARKSLSDEKLVEIRQSASICYFAGAKLEKLVGIWIEELDEDEKATIKNATAGVSPFGIHIQSLQKFIEKVTVFRNAVKYVDSGEQDEESKWHLAPLYEAYREYANIVASQGFLDLAQKYLALLPTQYPLADIDRERVNKAISKTSVPVTTEFQQASTVTAAPATVTAAPAATAATSTAYRPATTATAYQPQAAATTSIYSAFNPAVPVAPAPAQTTSLYAPVTNPYQPVTSAPAQQVAPSFAPVVAAPTSSSYGHAYKSSVSIPAPPPVGSPPHLHHDQPAIPPPPTSTQVHHKDVGGWNDTPVLKSNSRKTTPNAAPQPILSPFPGQQYAVPSQVGSGPLQPPTGASSATSPAFGRSSVIAPPPINAKPPQSVTVSPVQSPPPIQRVPPVPNPYAPNPVAAAAVAAPQTTHAVPPPPIGNAPQLLQQQQQQQQQPALAPPPTNRYAPPPQTPQQSANVASSRPPNPYAPVQQPVNTAPGHPPISVSAPPPPISAGYGQQALPSVAAPRTASPAPSSVAAPPSTTTEPTKYPAGDRSHIAPEALPIFEILSAEMARVKQKIPATFSRQVQDAEKRLNILFDHLNNKDLLSEESVIEIGYLAKAIQVKDFQTAQAIHINLVTTRTNECGQWMVGIKRLIEMARAVA